MLTVKPLVLISVVDHGWILERMATALASRLPYITLDPHAGTSARVRYYMNYHAWRSRSAELEVAFFTHLEREVADRQRFFQVARAVDYRVCHSRPSQEALRAHGHDARIIPPGVDLSQFRPRLRIGVVGRTYKTGRKGEDLVRQVLDVPGIEWAFTGSGWPLPSEFVTDEALPAFYRSLDYLLVPSLYEAGPMSVAEAIACGVPVIAPPIGWVPDFPHIPYSTGDVADLRRVLLDLVAEQEKRRAPVMALTWDAFAEKHDRLFREMLGPASFAACSSRSRSTALTSSRVRLALHGSERRAGGGPSTRVPRLARELAAQGVQAELVGAGKPLRGSSGITHVFNVWHPETALAAVRDARALSNKVVFSPITLDLSREHLWRARLIALVAHATSSDEIEDAFLRLKADCRSHAALPPHTPEPMPGFHSMVREMARRSDAIVALSETERRRLAALGAGHPNTRVIRNPVDPMLLERDDLFYRTYGVRDYVLCVGRIEPRKNQLALVQAMRTTDVPLVLLGHASNDEYAALIQRLRWPGLHLVDRLPHGSPLWRSAFLNARLFALPSWAEGGPLAALEAAAAGLPLVVADHADEREHFPDLATFVDPSDIEAIRAAVLAGHASPVTHAERADRQDLVVARHGWATHVAETVALYEEVTARAETRAPSTSASRQAQGHALSENFIVDLTTLANHRGRWTGIARLEACLATALRDELGARLQMIAWDDRARRFFFISPASIAPDAVRAALNAAVARSDAVAALAGGTRVVVGGSAWMQNPRYASGVASLVAKFGLRLTSIISDIIPMRAPYWYPDGYEPVFRRNFMRLLGASHNALAVSRATAEDVRRACIETGLLDAPPIGIFRLGDAVTQPSGAADGSVVNRLRDEAFVLAVGAVHLRKNYGLLQQAWSRLATATADDCPLLVIVGGVAWNGSSVDASLRQDRRIAHLFLNLEEVDDVTLDWLYAHALLTVYPSLDEGWGLPVAESLRRGVPCLASDIPSVSEIAPGLLETLPPDDPKAWAERIARFVRDPESRLAYAQRIAERYVGTDWSETARRVVTLATQLDGGGPPGGSREILRLGVRTDLRDQLVEGLRLCDGWTHLPEAGLQVHDAGAGLALDLEPDVDSDLLLTVEFAMPWAGTLVVAVAERPLCTWYCGWPGIHVYHAVIPRDAVSRPTLVRFSPSAAQVTLVFDEDPLAETSSGPVLRTLLVQRMTDLSYRPGEPVDVVRHASDAREGCLSPHLPSHSDVEVSSQATRSSALGSSFGGEGTRIVVQDSEPLLHGASLELLLKGSAIGGQSISVEVAVGDDAVTTKAALETQPRWILVRPNATAIRSSFPVVIDLKVLSGTTSGGRAWLLSCRVADDDPHARHGLRFARTEGSELRVDPQSLYALGHEWRVSGSRLVMLRHRGTMPLLVGQSRGKALRVVCEVAQTAGRDGTRLLAMHVGERSLAVVAVPQSGSTQIEVVIPCSLARSDGILELGWVVLNPHDAAPGDADAEGVLYLTDLRVVGFDGVVMEFDRRVA